MWYPATIAAPASEPITLVQAKTQCRIETADTSFDTEIGRLITAARSHAELVCGQRFGVRSSVALKCDTFEDFARLPEAPVNSVASVSYVDIDGDAQTLADTVYELRNDGLEVSIVLKYNQSWPAIRPGSRVTVTATIGAAPSESVVQAMLVWIDDQFHGREPIMVGALTVFDMLTINDRRNA